MEVTQEWLLENWNNLHCGLPAQPIWSDDEKAEITLRIVNAFESHKVSICDLNKWRNIDPMYQNDKIIRLLVELGSTCSPHVWKVDANTLTKGHQKKFTPPNGREVKEFETAILVLEKLGPALQSWREVDRLVPVPRLNPTESGVVELFEPSQLIEATENVLALLRGWHKWGTQNRRVLRNSIVHAKRIFRKFDISCSDGGNDSTLWMEILSDLWGLDGDNVIRNAVRSQ
ncbi:hypothetical protein [Aeromonas enteropelogenes]|uniref:hypothetical protein n=1 Tax=Aeromonas enteropelogenes TaxID=29489 RepID=UPI003BA0ED52